jgi:hypothetical protein
MSQFGALLQEIEKVVRSVLAEKVQDADGGADANDVTQLKRENTGLRNRVKTLEERVDSIEAKLKPSTTASAGTASVKGTAHGTK